MNKNHPAIRYVYGVRMSGVDPMTAKQLRGYLREQWL